MDTMGTLATENTRLRNENENLHEQVYFWKSQLSSDFEPPFEWGLTGSQTTIFRCLIARPLATRENIYTALYGGDYDRDMKNVDVMLCHVRRKLKPFGITVFGVWGRGWRLDENVRKRFVS